MKHDRLKIKELLEQDQQAPVSTEELEAVVRMLSVLEMEDEKQVLPVDFSNKIIGKIAQKKARDNRFGWFGYFAGIFGLIICLVVSLAFVDFKLDFGFLKSISRYSGLFMFGIAFVILLNLLEKKLFPFTSE